MKTRLSTTEIIDLLKQDAHRYCNEVLEAEREMEDALDDCDYPRKMRRTRRYRKIKADKLEAEARAEAIGEILHRIEFLNKGSEDT